MPGDGDRRRQSVAHHGSGQQGNNNNSQRQNRRAHSQGEGEDEEGFFDSMFMALGLVSARPVAKKSAPRPGALENNNNGNDSDVDDNDGNNYDGSSGSPRATKSLPAARRASMRDPGNLNRGGASMAARSMSVSPGDVDVSRLESGEAPPAAGQPRRELNLQHREVKDVEIPRWVPWVTGIVPMVLICPMIALAILIMYKSPGSDPALWNWRRGYVAATILNFIINLIKRFFDLLDHIRSDDIRDAIDAEQDISPDEAELKGCAKHCRTCLCFMVRWKGVWSYAVPALVYILCAFTALLFAAKIRQGDFSRPELASAAVGLNTAFIAFVFAEGAYFVYQETDRLNERKGGYIFIGITFVLLAIFMGVVWGVK